jgi:hypothetical protein
VVKVIEDLWILNDEGILLFNRFYKENINPDLFGAIMSTFYSYSKEISDGTGLLSFEFNTKKFNLMKKENLIYVAGSSINKENKKNDILIKKELEIIANKFINFYTLEFLRNWQGDTAIFSNFQSQIKDSLKCEKFKG